MKLSINNSVFMDIIQYSTLILVICISAVLFSKTYDVSTRFMIVVVDAVLYVLWGSWHHHSKGRLDTNILIEYGVVSIFIVFLVALGLGIIRFF